jgi:hypothetical protein
MRNISSVKNNAKVVLKISKDFGLEVNANTLNYTV